MGFRFRKSKEIGPFRLNISTSGVGYSVGGKGVRFTKKANGGTRTTVSIPGTGISCVKDNREYHKEKAGKNNMSLRHDAGNNTPNAPGTPGGNPEITLTEVILAWVLGYFGAHKFYRKKTWIGVLYVLTLGIFGVGWLGDAITLTAGYARRNSEKPLANASKIGIYVAVSICVLLLAQCGKGNDAKPVETIPPEPSTTISEEETTTPETEPTEADVKETTEPTEAPATSIPETEPVEANDPEPETVPATNAPETEPDVPEDPPTVPVTEPATEPVTEPATEPETTEEVTLIHGVDPNTIVYVSDRSKLIHQVSDCSGMKNYQEMTIEEAVSKDYKFCTNCWRDQ